MHGRSPEKMPPASGKEKNFAEVKTAMERQTGILKRIDTLEGIIGTASKAFNFIRILKAAPEKISVPNTDKEGVEKILEKTYLELRELQGTFDSFKEWISAPNAMPLEIDSEIDQPERAALRAKSGDFFQRSIDEHVAGLKWVLESFSHAASKVTNEKSDINMQKLDEIIANYKVVLSYMYKILRFPENPQPVKNK